MIVGELIQNVGINIDGRRIIISLVQIWEQCGIDEDKCYLTCKPCKGMIVKIDTEFDLDTVLTYRMADDGES